MKISKKTLLTVLSVVLVVALAISGTLAYLQSVSPKVVNSFEASNISVNLEETTGDSYKIIPGESVAKNPKVTLSTPDVDAYLFVEVTDETGGLVTWTASSDWEKVTGYDNIYVYCGNDATYNVLPKSNDAYVFSFLKDDKVTFDANLTLGDMASVDPNTKLSFKAYAIQAAPFNDAAAAWAGIVELPAASVTALTAEQTPAAGTLNDVTGSGNNLTLTAGSHFSTTDTAADIATAAYKDWTTDFRLSFSADVIDGSKVHLFGQYDGYGAYWLGDNLGTAGFDTLAAGETVRVIDAMMAAVGHSGATVKYSDVVNSVQNFNCGIVVEDDAFADGVTGVTATLELIMVDGDGHIHVVDTNTYTVN